MSKPLQIFFAIFVLIFAFGAAKTQAQTFNELFATSRPRIPTGPTASPQIFYTDWTATGYSSPSHVIEPLLDPGDDGDLTVTAANTVLNNYGVLAINANAGDQSFTVTNIADLNSSIPQVGPVAPGDYLMIIQMQGATINTTDTIDYGDVTALNSAGLYEFVTIDSIAGNTITLTCAGLRNSYTTTGRTQVIRVPQFNNLTVNAGASVIPALWNGTTGGMVVLQIANALTLNGSLNANAAGFRGGAIDNSTSNDIIIYRSTLSAAGGEKGEGIAGFQTDYDALNGRYGRGAPANGGGGGNGHNAGGGGGANGNNGNTWTGQGVMPGTVTGATAWQFDPGYIANGNALTNSSGGGRAGYTFSSLNLNATTAAGAPGLAGWGGDSRREVGGLGGRPLNNDPANRLFLGGGGGAGDGNNSANADGGSGGGLVFVMASTTIGTGTITANGQNAPNTVPAHNDAPGGGGGGGTVVLSSQILSGSITINANGGNGGNQLITSAEAEGPGGGVGGGYIAVRTGTPARTANGGLGGTTTSSSLTEFPRNGSTNGATGQSTASVIILPICLAPTAANVSISGRVMTAAGRGLPRARVTLTDVHAGTTQTTVSSAFGYYRFAELPAGRTYLISVSSKGYQFAPQTVTAVDDISGLDFIAQE